MRKFNIAILLVMLVWGVQGVFASRPTGEIKINLTDKRKVFETDFGNNLVLRVVKDSSIKHRDFGWILEVRYKSSKRNFDNLIHTNPTGTTADKSQVYAWHIANGEFPNHRVLIVKGHTQIIKIDLLNPKIEGEGEDARFISGKLKISWSR